MIKSLPEAKHSPNQPALGLEPAQKYSSELDADDFRGFTGKLPHCDRLLRSESDMMGSTAVLGILKLFFREEQLGESALFGCKGTVTLTDER